MKFKDYSLIDWKSHFYYDPSCPSYLRWKNDVYGGRKASTLLIPKDTPAGNKRLRINGNAISWVVSFNKVKYMVHRVLFTMLVGDIPDGYFVDHLDGNPLNNNISNLAVKTCAGNNQNKRLYSSNILGLSGINYRDDFRSKRYIANWYNKENIRASKSFSINKLGEEKALKEAILYRQQMLELMNRDGMQYTQRHIYGEETSVGV